MRRVGQARKRDANERIIIKALQACGWEVLSISGVGAPDLLAYKQGRWLPIEVKGPKGKLTPAQVRRQAVAPCPIVSSVEEAVNVSRDWSRR